MSPTPSDDDAAAAAPPPRLTRSLQGKVAIVTGAGAQGRAIGNGRAAALLLAEAGCAVVCVDVSEAAAQTTAAMIGEESGGGGRAVAVAADVADEEACGRVVREALRCFGRVDVLVNNVGVMGARGTATEVDMAAWAEGMRVNVASMVMMAKAAIPAMEKNDPADNDGFYRGAIVNVGSVAGLRGGTPSLLYPTAKGAAVNMTRAMAFHHAAQGIRVNCVCPGMLYTPMMYGSGMTPEMREARRNRSLLKTEGNGWDAGAAVRFLAGNESR